MTWSGILTLIRPAMCVYKCVRICAHRQALHTCVCVMYSHFSNILCKLKIEQKEAELDNPINNSGEVTYLIWMKTAKSNMRSCNNDFVQMWEFQGLQLLAGDI